MGITHVVRAEEHLTNTLRQCLILDALGYARPQYAHCSLILGEDRSKLSKRHGATSVDQYRQQVKFTPSLIWLMNHCLSCYYGDFTHFGCYLATNMESLESWRVWRYLVRYQLIPFHHHMAGVSSCRNEKLSVAARLE